MLPEYHVASKKVITLKATDSLSAAIHLMKEKKIRRIPVVNPDGKLVGIVSDRDLKDVSPSRATTLDIWELHYVLTAKSSGAVTPSTALSAMVSTAARATPGARLIFRSAHRRPRSQRRPRGAPGRYVPDAVRNRHG